MKRFFDIGVAFLLLVLLSPILLSVALLVRLKLGSPVLFQQERPGLGEKPFLMVKFRTMRDARGDDGCLLPDRMRISPLGRFLRSTSLDELPELWNVVKGDMSLVGPRPLLMRYLGYYTEKERRRHTVRPGITGLAQVNGRNALSWEEKLSLDVEYVDHQSFLLDLEILAMTISRVFGRSGVLDAAPQGPLDSYRKEQDASKSDSVS